MTTYSFSFPDFESFLTFVETHKPHKGYSESAGGRGYVPSFHGSPSFKKALELAHYGWPEGQTNMVEAMTQAAPVYVKVSSPGLDVAGAYPVVPLACAGDPLNMVSFSEEEKIKRPIVRLGVNIWVSSAYAPEYIMNYGAAVLSYVDALETNHTRVELSILVRSEYSGNIYELEMVAKKAEEHLELNRLAFMLAHPDMFRRLVFAHRTSEPSIPDRTFPNCYVQPLKTRDDMLTISGLNTFCEPSNRKLLNDPKAIAEKLEPVIARQLSEHGIEPPEIVWGNVA